MYYEEKTGHNFVFSPWKQRIYYSIEKPVHQHLRKLKKVRNKEDF